MYIARQCVNKMLYEEQKNIRQWVDQILVKWAQMYANYIKNDINSFALPEGMKELPQMKDNPMNKVHLTGSLPLFVMRKYPVSR